MLIDDDSVKSIQELIRDFKKYLELQKEYTKLEITEKLTVIISTLLLVVILATLGVIVLFYLSLSFAYLLAPYVGGVIVSYAIMAGIILLIMLLVYSFRKKLFVTPLVNFLANLFSN